MTEPTPDDSIDAFRRWAHWTAGRIINPYCGDYDDVVQEGLIEAWRVLQAKGGRDNVSATYLTQGMRRRMYDIVNGRPMYGGNRRPGPRTEPPHVRSLDGIDPGFDPLHAVELAYHHGEIVEALGSLTRDDCEYVLLRFWGGLTDTEIAQRRHVSNQNLWQNWHRRIRPRLQESLNHLVNGDD